jgi:hypothetical protein
MWNMLLLEHVIVQLSELDDILEHMPIPDYYKENVFDCSERSAFVEWYLENIGISARIVVGYAKPFLSEGENHAWVEAYVQAGVYGYGWALIETSGIGLFGQVLKPYVVNIVESLFIEYQPRMRFENIYEAVQYYGSIEEWDWWNVVK